MSTSTSRVLAPLLVLALVSSAVAAEAGQRRGASGGSAQGRAVPRSSAPPRGGVTTSRGVSPRVIAPYRPYYYPYYGYPYGLGLSFGYSLYGYPYGYGFNSYYGSGYPYGLYSYPSAGYAYPGYVGVRPGLAYGGLRIEGAPSDAQVYADGYYVGIVDDFDGSIQRLSLTPGPHQIEIRIQGSPSLMVDVRIEPGETITYHAAPTR